MKKSILLIFVLMLIPMIVMAELPNEKKASQADMMNKEFKLVPFMEHIQNGKISSNHTAILYAILQNTYEVCIHQQNGAKDNKVYVHQDGHKEAVYDKDGQLVKDGINDGSYNYFHPSEEPLYHFSFDICPWIMWGQSRTDDTTIKSRIYAYMGDLEGGIRRALVQTDRPTMEWKPDGQIQALAIFMCAIKQGNAESLFTLFEQNTKVTNIQLVEVLTKLNKGLEKVFSVPNNLLNAD